MENERRNRKEKRISQRDNHTFDHIRHANPMPVIPALDPKTVLEYQIKAIRKDQWQEKYLEIAKKHTENLPKGKITKNIAINIVNPDYNNETREFYRIPAEYGIVELDWKEIFTYRINPRKNGYGLLKTLRSFYTPSVFHPLSVENDEIYQLEEELDEEDKEKIEIVHKFTRNIHNRKTISEKIPKINLSYCEYEEQIMLEKATMPSHIIYLPDGKYPEMTEIYDRWIEEEYQNCMSIGNITIGGFIKIFQTENDFKKIMREARQIIEYNIVMNAIIEKHADFSGAITI